ncbi:MAG: hypothetical protein M3Y87_15850 [Myxococcota bacterium]|nr:hypothetical protein [Myxococcota bacterium]
MLGILGWGYFALGADLVLSRAKGWARALVVPIAPLVGHALIAASWWALFRWTLRGDLGVGSLVALVAITVPITIAVARARSRGDGIPLGVAGPRVIAAALFFVLLVRVAPADLALWIHVACVALPYSLATQWRPVTARVAVARGAR